MPRDERPPALRASRRAFLRGATLSVAGAGLSGLACSGAPREVPRPAPLTAVPPPPGEAAPPPPPPEARDARLATLREFDLGPADEPATVFVAGDGA